MLQIAAFVDAGYLYAQGSSLLAGRRQPRSSVQLAVPAMLAQLRSTVGVIAPDARLLRVYWYDGLSRGGQLSREQVAIAGSPFVKLRLGTVNSRGEQKGVDSLIVTDLIDLARNRAITDALILSGDEDIRVGVQVAQTFGVCVHLLGVKPARGSQSPDLVQESDTHQEWDEGVVGRWMTVRSRPELAPGPDGPKISPGHGPTTSDSVHAVIKAHVEHVVSGLDPTEKAGLISHLDDQRDRIPVDVDRPTLARLRNLLGRDLTDEERRAYRQYFVRAVRENSLTM